MNAQQQQVFDEKRLATLAARFALRGYALTKVDGGWLITRWGLAKLCRGVEDVEQFFGSLTQ
jgi:hypothetical protein